MARRFFDEGVGLEADPFGYAEAEEMRMAAPVVQDPFTYTRWGKVRGREKATARRGFRAPGPVSPEMGQQEIQQQERMERIRGAAPAIREGGVGAGGEVSPADVESMRSWGFAGEREGMGPVDLGTESVHGQTAMMERMGMTGYEPVTGAFRYGGVPMGMEAIGAGAGVAGTLGALGIGTALAGPMALDRAVGQEMARQEVESVAGRTGLGAMEVAGLGPAQDLSQSAIGRGLSAAWGGIRGLFGYEDQPSDLEAAAAGMRGMQDVEQAGIAGLDLGAIGRVDPGMMSALKSRQFALAPEMKSTAVERLGVDPSQMAFGRRVGRADIDPFGHQAVGRDTPEQAAAREEQAQAAAAQTAQAVSAVKAAPAQMVGFLGNLFGPRMSTEQRQRQRQEAARRAGTAPGYGRGEPGYGYGSSRSTGRGYSSGYGGSMGARSASGAYGRGSTSAGRRGRAGTAEGGWGGGPSGGDK